MFQDRRTIRYKRKRTQVLQKTLIVSEPGSYGENKASKFLIIRE